MVLAGLIVVVGVGATWWLTRGSAEAGVGPLGPETAKAGDQLLEDPFAREEGRLRLTDNTSPAATAPPPPAGKSPRPVTIQQGRGETGFEPDQALKIDQPRTLGESLAQAPTQEPERRTERPDPGQPAATGVFERAVAAAEQRLAAGDPVAARSVLNQALHEPGLGEEQRSGLRARLTAINEELVFSAKVVAGDPLTDTHAIASGEYLSTLPAKLGLAIDWRLLQRVNAIPNPDKIRLGQKLKLVRGPFHAVVDKSDYRLDLYAGAPEDGASWTYIRSVRVGLGEGDSTPTGDFVVKRNSKLFDPHWVNPRTGERFDKTNPDNPIGDWWIGIEGLGADAVKTGYGLHGTIDPPSIGQQKSMGCVRMLDADVELVYAMLVEGISRVRIQD
jgi:lipoprotein-anchoring transpeptidase ErfK/SrfK